MKTHNSIKLIGFIGNSPELKEIGDAKTTVANFSIALKETYKDKDGNKKEETDWIDCVAWSKIAENIGKYVKKGDYLLIDGRLKTNVHKGEDEKSRKYTQVRVDSFDILTKKEV